MSNGIKSKPVVRNKTWYTY